MPHHLSGNPSRTDGRRRPRAYRAVAVAAVCAALGGLAACSSSSSSPSTASKTQTVTLFTTLSGVIPGTNELPWQQWSAAFEKVYPDIHVNVITGSTTSEGDAMEARIVAAAKAGQAPPIDVLDSSGYIPPLAALGDLVPVSPSMVPNVSKINPTQLATYSNLGIPYRGSSVVLAYNSAEVKNPPTTLTGLIAWIKAHPGKFTYNNPSGGGPGNAFSEDVINQYIPASMASQFVNSYQQSLESYWTPGISELHALTPYMYGGSNYPKSATDTMNDLANGSIWMSPEWSDGANAALDNGELPKTIKLVQITPPFYGGPSYLALIKGSTHLAAAEKLINWMLSPAAQELIFQGMNGYPGVELKYAPADVQQKFGSIDTTWSDGWYSTYNEDFYNIWQQRVP